MCKCNPNVRTPYCGKLGCQWPGKEGIRKEFGGDQKSPMYCPDCGWKLVKAHWELEDGSGWVSGYLCDCKYNPLEDK